MKKIVFLLLTVFILACSATDLPLISQPTSTPLPLPDTFTPGLPPTITPTPTEIGVLPSSTPTDTPAPTGTPLAITPTGSLLDTPTVVPISSLTDSGFESINLSTNEFHWGSCSPTTVSITANVNNPSLVFSVVLFIRFRDQASGTTTRWDKGTSMKDQGLGTYAYTLDGNKLGVTVSSWVGYQIVATDKNANVVARSPVFSDSLILSPCP